MSTPRTMFLLGWQEGVNAASVKARDMARRMRGYVANDAPDENGRTHALTLETLSRAALLEQFADMLTEVKPPRCEENADYP